MYSHPEDGGADRELGPMMQQALNKTGLTVLLPGFEGSAAVSYSQAKVVLVK